ncbi:MAG: energy transducer TonB [Magnetococcales bacterium]|nr:energy transducer TonB [Magnetococcales bacterium]
MAWSLNSDSYGEPIRSTGFTARRFSHHAIPSPRRRLVLPVRSRSHDVQKNSISSSKSLLSKPLVVAKKNSIHKKMHDVKSVSSTITKSISTISPILLNTIRDQLNNALKGRFFYPRLARKIGWQGIVIIRLNVQRDGALSDIRVVRSSGRSLLDEAALLAVKKIEPLVGVHLPENMGVLAFNLSVRYEINPYSLPANVLTQPAR